MAVSSTTNKVIYTGSGTTGPFDFDFPVYASSDLVVEKYTIATEATTTLAETTDYTVTIDVDGTGRISTVAAVTSSYKLIIRRVLPLTQEIDYVENDPFPAATHEEGLDRGVMLAQQLQEQIDRCVKVGITDTDPQDLVDSINAAAASTAADAISTASDRAAAELAAANFEFASQAEAEAGTNETHSMNPKRTAQAIAALASVPVKSTGAEIDTGTDDAKFATPKAIADSGIAFETAWTDYTATSTIVGWSSFTALKKIFYKRIGKTVFVSFIIEGTSNSATTTFTLPFAQTNGFEIDFTLGSTYDNGSYVASGLGSITTGNPSLVNMTKSANAAFTGSGSKLVAGQFFYEAA